MGSNCGELVRVGGLLGGGDPALVFAEQVPHGVEQLGLDALEIEVEDDDGPRGAIVFGQRLFDDGAHAFEEVIAQRGLGAGGLGVVRDHGAALAGGVDAQARSCSMPTGKPVLSARSMRSFHSPLYG